MIKKIEILETLEMNQAQIKSFGVKRIGLFGSFAMDTQNKKSDIDILVEFKRGQKSFDHYMDLKAYLEQKLKRKVDLVIKEALKPRVRPAILKQIQYAGL